MCVSLSVSQFLVRSCLVTLTPSPKRHVFYRFASGRDARHLFVNEHYRLLCNLIQRVAGRNRSWRVGTGIGGSERVVASWTRVWLELHLMARALHGGQFDS